MPETVAIHLTSDRVVLARATVASSGVELAEIISQEVPAGTDPHEAAIALAKQKGLKNLGLVVLVNWDQYSLRDAWLPFTDEAKLRSTVKFELEDDFGADSHELLMPFQVLESRPDSSHILAWVGTKGSIGQEIKTWEQAGLSPEYMPPDIVGHAGLVSALVPDLADKPLVVVSSDERSVHLSLLQGDVIWARRRLMGFAWATDAAGRPLQELRRTILNTPSFPTPAAVVSFGGEPADVLAGVVARDLGCEHRVIAPPQLNDGQRHLHWPLAAGAALLAAKSSSRPLTFRLEEFEPRETVQTVSLLGVVATALLGVIFLVGGLWLVIQARDADRITETVDAYINQFWTSQLPKDASVPDRLEFREKLAAKVDSLEKKLAAAREWPDPVRRLDALLGRLNNYPQTITSLEVKSISVKPDGIMLKGQVSPHQGVAQLKECINASRELLAEVQEVSNPGEGVATFTMKIAYADLEKSKTTAKKR